MTTLIAAAADDNAIGKGSNLLWHLPKDSEHFKNPITGHCTIMGHKTSEIFPKLLPQRTHIVITRQRDYTPEGVIIVGSLQEAIHEVLLIDPCPYIIGGGETYVRAPPLADVIELTCVYYTFVEADVSFPPVPPTHFTLISKGHVAVDEKYLYPFTFERYIKADNQLLEKCSYTFLAL